MQAASVSEFLQRIEGEIQSRRLLARGQKILVAVSGGADSMVLLHTLNSLASENRWQISVAHFNHQLRGRASEADETLVRRTAAKRRLSFFGGSADVKTFASRSKISVEMAARKLRHEFLAKVAREQKISTIALAHHADDQVELFFLRLLRGAGGEGLAGMKWRSPSPAGGKTSLVRPLLACTKAELLAFARDSKIQFRDDATNFSADFLRNRIRNELLPLLRKKYQPAVDKSILRLMDIVGAEAEFVGMAACAAVGEFSGRSTAVQRRFVQQQLIAAGVVSDFDLVEQLRRTPGKFVCVSPGLAIARDEAGAIELRELFQKGFSGDATNLRFRGKAGRAALGDRKFQWQFLSQKVFSVPQPKPGTEFFDADKVGDEIILRHWRAGDRFQPIGMKLAAKLQDLFVNAKIPAARRRKLVLAATAAGEIFWVEGLRIGENFKLSPTTKRQLRWNCSKITG